MYPKRVKLPFLPGVEGSDYINATYLQVRLGGSDYIARMIDITLVGGEGVEFWNFTQFLIHRLVYIFLNHKFSIIKCYSN